jgi:polyphosphate kinase
VRYFRGIALKAVIKLPTRAVRRAIADARRPSLIADGAFSIVAIERRISDASKRKTLPLHPKELSWLSFNARVLQEAEDPEVPLIERVRFMGIFSNNLDEFYRVRYADVRRLAAFAKGREKARWEQLLDDIRDAVGDLQMRFDHVYRTCLAELRANSIYLIDERQIDEPQREFVRRYFFGRVMPALSPIILSDNSPIPQLEDGSIYLAVRLQLANQNSRYAIVNIPSDRLPRFVVLPAPTAQTGRQVLMVLDNIIRACLPEVFEGVFPITQAPMHSRSSSRATPNWNSAKASRRASSMHSQAA